MKSFVSTSSASFFKEERNTAQERKIKRKNSQPESVLPKSKRPRTDPYQFGEEPAQFNRWDELIIADDESRCIKLKAGESAKETMEDIARQWNAWQSKQDFQEKLGLLCREVMFTNNEKYPCLFIHAEDAEKYSFLGDKMSENVALFAGENWTGFIEQMKKSSDLKKSSDNKEPAKSIPAASKAIQRASRRKIHTFDDKSRYFLVNDNEDRREIAEHLYKQWKAWQKRHETSIKLKFVPGYLVDDNNAPCVFICAAGCEKNSVSIHKRYSKNLALFSKSLVKKFLANMVIQLPTPVVASTTASIAKDLALTITIPPEASTSNSTSSTSDAAKTSTMTPVAHADETPLELVSDELLSRNLQTLPSAYDPEVESALSDIGIAEPDRVETPTLRT